MAHLIFHRVCQNSTEATAGARCNIMLSGFELLAKDCVCVVEVRPLGLERTAVSRRTTLFGQFTREDVLKNGEL